MSLIDRAKSAANAAIVAWRGDDRPVGSSVVNGVDAEPMYFSHASLIAPFGFAELKTPIQSGEVVAVMGRAIGLWWLNACRIVYVVDESGPIRKFGFAYGTLPGHVESGEERFLIEWHRGENSVWYDILAFSRPNHFLTRLGYPMVRRTQKRFGRDSAASMLEAVRNEFLLNP